MGDRATHTLASMKQFMSDHNAAIMAVLCLVLGAKIGGQALGALLS